MVAGDLLPYLMSATEFVLSVSMIKRHHISFKSHTKYRNFCRSLERLNDLSETPELLVNGSIRMQKQQRHSVKHKGGDEMATAENVRPCEMPHPAPPARVPVT